MIAVETPLSIWDPTLLSAGLAAFLSGELSRAQCFPSQMVVTWGSGALCCTEWFLLHAKLNLFGEISRSPASLGFLWNGKEVAPCLCSDEHQQKTCPSMQSSGTGRAQPDAIADNLFSPFLSFRVATTWSAVLHGSRWTCDESHGYGFPCPAQLPTGKPSLPSATFLLQHTTSPLRAGGEILHVRTLWLSDLTVWEEGATVKWPQWRASTLLNTC